MFYFFVAPQDPVLVITFVKPGLTSTEAIHPSTLI